MRLRSRSNLAQRSPRPPSGRGPGASLNPWCAARGARRRARPSDVYLRPAGSGRDALGGEPPGRGSRTVTSPRSTTTCGARVSCWPTRAANNGEGAPGLRRTGAGRWRPGAGRPHLAPGTEQEKADLDRVVRAGRVLDGVRQVVRPRSGALRGDRPPLRGRDRSARARRGPQRPRELATQCPGIPGLGRSTRALGLVDRLATCGTASLGTSCSVE
jgi:hypothetical protein